MTSFTRRLIGAARLDVRTYEEVENDPSALGQALGVVVLSSLAAGFGAAWRGGPGIVLGVVGTLIGWLVWAWLTYIIGTRLLPAPQTRADWGQLLRTTGFAAAPGILRMFGFVPVIRWLVYFVAAVWTLAAFVIAVRQALDYTSTLRAVGVCVLGWIAYALISLLFLGLVPG